MVTEMISPKHELDSGLRPATRDRREATDTDVLFFCGSQINLCLHGIGLIFLIGLWAVCSTAINGFAGMVLISLFVGVVRPVGIVALVISGVFEIASFLSSVEKSDNIRCVCSLAAGTLLCTNAVILLFVSGKVLRIWNG